VKDDFDQTSGQAEKNRPTKPSGTLIWYYYICPREVWFMSRQLNPSQENPFIEIGKLISEESYERERKEVRVDNIVIDVLKDSGGKVLVGEVKKSSRYEKSAMMQLCYYLLRLKYLGIEAKGLLLFPKEKKRIEVNLSPEIENELENAINEIEMIKQMSTPPKLKKTRFCAKCGFIEVCWS